MCLSKTDRKVSSNIWMSQSSLNCDNAILIAKLVKATVPEFRKLLKFGRDVKFRVAPIKKREVQGRYWARSMVVELDSRQSPENAMLTLAHELVHAEQYYQKRLASKWRKKQGWVSYWNGKVNNSKGATFNSYMNQPWEVEAYQRQGELVNTVHLLMLEKINAKK